MAAATIGSSLLGASAARNAARRQAGSTDYATRMNARGYTDARPYIQRMYQGGEGALNDALAAGYFGGPTYAGLNDMQTAGLNNQYNFGNRAFGAGQGFMDATGGFGANYADMFNQAGQDRVAAARDYATANSQPLIDARMRGVNRQLNEVALPQNAMEASATGNTRNSRAGVTEAILRRAAGETEADITATTNQALMRQKLAQDNTGFNQMLAANRGLGSTYNMGFGMGNTGIGNMITSGGAYQRDLQNQYDDTRANFEGGRDFALDQYNRYNAGILGRAPMSPPTQQPNLVDPTMSAIGGAMAGAGFGMNMYNAFNQPSPTLGMPLGSGTSPPVGYRYDHMRYRPGGFGV